MDTHTSSDARRDPAAVAARHARQRRREMLITTAAVAAVALAALGAALAPQRAERDVRHAATSAPTRVAAAPGNAATTEVVTAPPLSSVATAPDTKAMGGAPACTKCGIVENVVAVHGSAQGKIDAIGFLMSIRMDDGTVRTVEQRGALAAGSRVVVEGNNVRAMGPGA